MEAYLSYTGESVRTIGGVGEFGKDLPALKVSASIANQYDNDEMRDLGWLVSWEVPDENIPAEIEAAAVSDGGEN